MVYVKLRKERKIRPRDIVITISDEGRTHIGGKDANEAKELQEMIINSVSKETEKEWIKFMESRHHEAVINRLDPDLQQTDQTYPKKNKIHYATTSTETDTESKIVTSNKKIVKKFDTFQLVQSDVPTPSTSLSFEENAKKREELRRQIQQTVSVKKTRTVNVADVLGESKRTTTPETPIHFEPEPEPSSSSNILAGYGFVDVEECIFFQNGHCFNLENCQFAHNGKVNNINSSSSDELSDYPNHPAEVGICPGYLNQTCWNMSCNFRHVLYATDQIEGMV